MSASHPGELVHAYLDDELGAEAALQVRAHLAGCAGCRREYESARALRSLLQRTLQGEQPSADFLRRLQGAVRRDAPAPRRRALAPVALGALAAALVAGLVLRPPAPGPDLTGEVVAAHLRSLQARHLTDVASSDQHTVKPWFQGQVPFGPAVRDLATQGFPLEGGRLDYLDRQAVATLVYRARAHAINVFIWPGAPGAASALVVEHRDGVHAAHWAQDGLQVWAVSDVNEAELRRLVALLR